MNRHIILGVTTLALAFGTITAAAQTQSAPAATNPAAAKCTTCGTIESIRYVEEKGKGSGGGAVIGGVAGGVIGHQFGSGRGNTVATIAGAGVGALAGNQVEKNAKKKSYWVVNVNLDSGKKQSVTSSSKPDFRQGDRVKILDGNRLALLAN